MRCRGEYGKGLGLFSSTKPKRKKKNKILEHLLSGGAAVLPDIKPCVLPPGLTGGGSPVMEWKCWLNIWATCQMSTKWDGEDRDLQKRRSTQTSQLPRMCPELPCVAAPKYSSGIRGRCTPQRTLLRSVNTNWVSPRQVFFFFFVILSHDSRHRDMMFCFQCAATRLQAKYKGYRAKGEFKKQKEAGK